MYLQWMERKVGDRPFLTSLTENESSALCMAAPYDAVCLEIGSAYGYSAALLTHKSFRTVVAVDPHEGYGSLPDSLEVMRGKVDPARVFILPVKSEEILPVFVRLKVKFDLVFVDGDHRFEAVTSDLKWGWRVLKEGGTIAAHDYGEDTCPDVKEAVDRSFGIGKGHVIDTLWIKEKRIGR